MRNKFWKYIIFVISAVIICCKVPKIKEPNFLKFMLNSSNHHFNENSQIIDFYFKYFAPIDPNKPQSLVKKSFYPLPKTIEKPISKLVSIEEKKPLVYIYNSHQHENYSKEGFENEIPNVMMASRLLKEKLDKLNIKTIFEEINLIEFLRINNWSYADSYKASRFFVKDTLEKNPNLLLIIDLHRDDLTKEQATVKINNKDYAKILFLVGTNHSNSSKNLKLVQQLNDLSNKLYPKLSRGIYKRPNSGNYNQDLNDKMFLLEVGGQHNTFLEVENTIEAVSIIIKELIQNES